MLYSTFLIAATTLATLSGVQALNYSTSGPLSIDVSQISDSDKLAWCNAQQNSCPELCGGYALNNTCDAPTLNYNCTCPGSPQPNITNFAQTIPFYVCQVWISNCVDNHPNDLVGITACRSVVCGNASAEAVEAAVSSSEAAAAASTSAAAAASSSATATTTHASSTGASATGASATPSSTKNAAVSALNVAKEFGTPALGAALLAVFGLAL